MPEVLSNKFSTMKFTIAEIAEKNKKSLDAREFGKSLRDGKPTSFYPSIGGFSVIK